MERANYDIIIIGTGAGGGTLLDTLKSSGKKILVLERGTFLPKEKANWNTVEVFQHGRYHNTEHFYDEQGRAFKPGMGYWVGGNTKVYGAALFRLRERDFETIQHAGGISPEWPLKYADFEPYYARAEKLYNVHGKRGLDPTEPFMRDDYPHEPVAHEPIIQDLHDNLKNRGYHPFYIPLGVKLNEKDKLNSKCIRCDTCDGFPCLIDAKADADINCVRPAVESTNVTLVTNAKVNRLLTDTSGKTIVSVEVEIEGKALYVKGDVIVVSCGAINSAVLLLKSYNDKHPNGLANKSDQVGRNLMKHQNAAMLAISRKMNRTVFQKTMAINDFYFGDGDFKFPMGHIQLLGKSNKDMLAADAPKFAPGFVLDQMAEHAIDWWMTGEDLPDPANRVLIKGDEVHLNYTENNQAGFERMRKKWKMILEDCDVCDTLIDHKLYIGKKIPLAGLAHQCGTMRFGESPASSVLDINCKTHELDNLYVVDGSFFVSSGAVNPSLTIMANAIRVGEHLKERLNSK
jgi:choline dehydrogenase-like flavoprotein